MTIMGHTKQTSARAAKGSCQSAFQPQEQQDREDGSRVVAGAKARQEKPRLVLVEWEDAYGCSTSWESIDGVDPSPIICQSVGWLVYDGADRKVVVPHLLHHYDSTTKGCGDMTIPVGMIVRIVDLAETVSNGSIS